MCTPYFHLSTVRKAIVGALVKPIVGRDCDYSLLDFCFNFSMSDDTRTLAVFVLSGSRVMVISIMSPSRQLPRKDVGILNVTGLLSCDMRTAKDPSIPSIVAFISVISIYCSHTLSHCCQHPPFVNILCPVLSNSRLLPKSRNGLQSPTQKSSAAQLTRRRVVW